MASSGSADRSLALFAQDRCIDRRQCPNCPSTTSLHRDEERQAAMPRYGFRPSVPSRSVATQPYHDLSIGHPTVATTITPRISLATMRAPTSQPTFLSFPALARSLFRGRVTAAPGRADSFHPPGPNTENPRTRESRGRESPNLGFPYIFTLLTAQASIR